MVIDDSNDILMLTSLVLGMEGYDVSTADSGERGLQKLCNEVVPDLILLDNKMEEMSGPQFLLELEKYHASIYASVPIIMMTGMDMKAPNGVKTVLKKPVGMNQLISAVKKYIN